MTVISRRQRGGPWQTGRQTGGRQVIDRRQRLLERRHTTLEAIIQRLRGEFPFMQRFRLTPATHAKYVLALEKFLAHWLLEQLPAWSAVTWDAALQDHVELLFEGGKDRRAASCLTAAVLWLAPGFGRPTTADLPLTVASLRNWTGLEPDFSKPPLPYAIMMSIVLWLATHGQGQAGLLTWMLFETYLRVNEGLTMQTEDIVIAGPLLSGESTAVAVMACSSSRLLAANAEEQDLCLSLDLARHRPLAALLCRWAGLRRGDARLWDLTYPHLLTTRLHLSTRPTFSKTHAVRDTYAPRVGLEAQDRALRN